MLAWPLFVALALRMCVCVYAFVSGISFDIYTLLSAADTHVLSHSLSLCLSLFPSAYTLALLITHTHVDVCSAAGRRDRVHSV